MSDSTDRILRYASPLLVVVVGAVLFGGTLSAPFTGDDVLVALESPQAYDPSNALKYIFHDLDWMTPEDLDGVSDPEDEPSRFGLYRPLLITTFIIDTLLWHQEPFGWRLTNLILHLIAGLLVLGLATHFLGSRIGGLAAALLFVAHPIHVEAVASLLSGRAEMLVFISLTASWWLFLAGDKKSGARRWAFDIGSALLFLLGLWSKENAIVLPGILALAGWSMRGQSIRTLIVRLIPHMVIFGIYLAIRLSVIGRVAANDWSIVFGDASTGQIILTMMTVMALYIRLLFLPWPLLHPECYETMPSTVTVLEGVLSTILVLGLIGVSIWLLIRSRKRGRSYFWAFGLLFFYGCLVPVSHIVPFRVVMGARFLYLPSLALCLLGGFLLVRAFAYRRWLPLAAGAPVLGVYTLIVLVSNPVWVDPDRLYGMVAECNPHSPSPYNNLGTHRLRQGKPAEALPYFKKAAALGPQYARARYNLAYSLHLLGRTREAEAAYLETLKVESDHGLALNNLGILAHARGDRAGARNYFELAVRADPRHPAPIVNLGNLEQQEGNLSGAEKRFRLALKIAPRLTDARFNLGRLLEQTQRVDEAEQQYQKILEYRPNHAMANNNLANILKDRGKPEEAESHYRTALRSDPKCAPAHQNLATLLLSQDKAEKALEHYQTALRLKPNDVDVLLGLGYTYLRLKQLPLALQAAQDAVKAAPTDPRVQKLLQLTVQPPE
jgi:tetratricopeptide (TPR) repeat protein